MSDDNLCGDIRALVTVLREIRDEQKRVADALERVAERVSPPGGGSLSETLAGIAGDVGFIGERLDAGHDNGRM